MSQNLLQQVLPESPQQTAHRREAVWVQEMREKLLQKGEFTRAWSQELPQQNRGGKFKKWGPRVLSLCSVHVLSVSVWVSTRCSASLLQSKDPSGELELLNYRFHPVIAGIDSSTPTQSWFGNGGLHNECMNSEFPLKYSVYTFTSVTGGSIWSKTVCFFIVYAASTFFFCSVCFAAVTMQMSYLWDSLSVIL